MHAYVFPDAALARHAGRFVWLELNTDLPQSAGFLERFPMENWPTLYVIDPREERALVRFEGSATVAQLERLLEDGERAYAGAAGGGAGALARGDALYGEGHALEAARAYEDALAQAPGGWERRGRAVESLLGALRAAEQHGACARRALEELARLPRSPSLAAAATLGLTCALDVEGEEGVGLREALEGRAREALAPPPIAMAADDRSGLYDVLVSARQQAGDEAGARALASDWLTFLEGEAARAPGPEARTVFDSHRMAAALVLGDPMRVVPALERSERELPQDYNPPARLASLYRRLGRLDEALAAAERALARVEGARRLRVYGEKADIQLERGDVAGAVQALEEALRYAQGMPPVQVPLRTRARLERQLQALRGGGAGER